MMWPQQMSRQDMEMFIRENLDEFLDILLTAYGMTVDEIVTEHMMDEAEEFVSDTLYWEAC